MSQARSASGDPKNEAHLRQGTYSFILLRALKCVESCSEKQARGQSSEMERSGALLGEGETCKRGRVKEYSSLLRTFFKWLRRPFPTGSSFLTRSKPACCIFNLEGEVPTDARTARRTHGTSVVSWPTICLRWETVMINVPATSQKIPFHFIGVCISHQRTLRQDGATSTHIWHMCLQKRRESL